MATRPLPLNRLLERLDSDWYLTRQAAVRQAEALPCDTLECLLQLAAQRGQRKQRQSAVRVLCLLGTTLLVALLLWTLHFPAQSLIAMALCFAVFGWLLILLPLAVMGQEQQAYPVVLDICAATLDPRFIGATLARIKMLRHTNAEESPAARQTRVRRLQAVIVNLTATLQAVHSENAPTLTREQHALLLFLLDPRRTEAALSRAALYALAFIGQESALPVVSELKLDSALPDSVREAAKICCTQLEARLALARQSGSLLRASGIHAVAGENSLLRPASVQQDAPDPAQLLRAAASTADE